jgi:23S rRNA pseudouridine2605 synthase
MADNKPQKGPAKKSGDYSKFFKGKKAKLKSLPDAPEPKKKKSPSEERYKVKKHPDLYDKEGYCRLNKYIAHAGICSRREADRLIEDGEVKVNGKINTEMGFKVKASDKVSIAGKVLQAEKLQYVLLNKPRGFITTTDDPHDRKTVMMLVQRACNERIYPVGRLDRDTTGLLLFTNDGDLAKKLTHPKHRVRKMYHVFLDKEVVKSDLVRLVEGIELEDGQAAADKASYVEGQGKNEVGIELHSGKNRIVRRMFEQLGYRVIKLDRVIFSSLTKKDLPRGRWRHLTDKEIHFLKMI